MKSSSF